MLLPVTRKLSVSLCVFVRRFQNGPPSQATPVGVILIDQSSLMYVYMYVHRTYYYTLTILILRYPECENRMAKQASGCLLLVREALSVCV
jgi:hypothetical protein